MTTSTSSNSEATNAPLALVPLEIPGHTGPIPSGELGINIAAAVENFKLGLQVFIPAWTSMGEGDSVQVLLGDVVVVSDSIDQSEVGQRRVLFIESERLTPGATTLAYKVTRLGQTPEQSAELDVYVKLDRPGGQDQNGDIPGHSELHLEIDAQIVEGGVDKDQAAEGVPVTIKAYPNMAEHDEIRLSWGGQFVTHTVLASEVGSDVVITVDEATILAAGDSGPEGLAVTFDVYDMVENHSEDWAAETRLVVDTDSTRLTAPIIKEAVNNVLDLDVLGDKPVTAQVIAIDNNFAVGDQIEVTLRGTAADGTPVEFTCSAETIASVPSIVDIEVPSIDIRLLAQAQAIFSYRLIKLDGTPDLLSKGRFVSVIGEVQRLAAPIAQDERLGAIDPALPSTRIEIPWDEAMQAGQVIDLKWLGVRPNLSVYFPELEMHNITNGEYQAKLPILMVVAGEHLAAIDGGTLELYYELLSDVTVRRVVKRESLHAAVLTVGEPKAELPAPTVLHEEDGVLDPEGVPPEGTRLIVPMYNGITSGDEVHYQWTGSATGVATDWIKLNSITAAKPVPFDIRKNLVADNLGGTVEASYYVVRADGRTSASDVLALRIGEQAGEAPTITSVTDSEGEVANNGTTFDTTVTLNGKAVAGQKVQVLDGTTSKGEVVVNASGDWTLQLTGLSVASHSFTAKGLYGSNPVSSAWVITVGAVGVKPVITTVVDSKGGAIPENGNTSDTIVTLTGTAKSGSSIEINDGATSWGTAPATGGNWTKTLNGLTVKAYSMTAKDVSDVSQVSEPWSFRVKELGITWDFKDGTLQGWVAQGIYKVHAHPSDGYVYVPTNYSHIGNYRGHVMAHAVNVTAGKTYDFSFQTKGGMLNSATLCLTVNDVRIGATIAAVPAWTFGYGVYVASSTGTVTLKIWNETATYNDSGFYINVITMTPR